MTLWRFDQGRLDYFQFDEIKQLARALASINGIEKPKLENDLIRKQLSFYSARPFLPVNYTVWRNYKRVFACLLLATEIDNKIICTELCQHIDKNFAEIDVDDYLGHFATHFYYPSPVFEGYNISEPVIFPVIAIIKFIVSQLLIKQKNYISIEEIASYLIANTVTGIESLDFYANLQPKNIQVDLRQLRELTRFISQFSFLKWHKSILYIEITDKAEALQIINTLTPFISERHLDANKELFYLGKTISNTLSLSTITNRPLIFADTEFVEGNKVRVSHLRSERSVKLKEFYFYQVSNAHICDMCAMDTLKIYPWVERLIELHHLLPLASPIRIDISSSSLKDIVGLCPSCHRATHKYYSQWLKRNALNDFKNYEQARAVYQAAKQEIILR